MIRTKNPGTVYCVTRSADTLLTAIMYLRELAKTYAHISTRNQSQVLWNHSHTEFQYKTSTMNLPMFKAQIVKLATVELPAQLG